METKSNLWRYRKITVFLGYLLFFSFIFFGCNEAKNDGKNNVVNTIKVPANATSDQLNTDALDLFKEVKYEEATAYALKSLSLNPGNPGACYALSLVNQRERNWTKAIEYGEKCNEAGSAFIPGYANLFNAYFGAGRWDDAVRIGQKTLEADPSATIEADLQHARKLAANETRSQFFVLLLIIALISAFVYRVYKQPQKNKKLLDQKGADISIIEVVLLAASVSFVFWIAFFSIADWVRSFNPHISGSEFTPTLGYYVFERDGYESFVLYAMTILNVSITCLLSALIIRLRKDRNIYVGVFGGLLLVTALYFVQIGFFPPMSEGSVIFKPQNIVVPVIYCLLALGLYTFHRKYPKLIFWILVPVLGFLTLLPLGPSSPVDLAYLLDPALRLIHGARTSEIYFQYDLFLSFLGYVWMKLNLAITLFPILGQLSFLLFFLSIYWFADAFFLSKGLSVFLLTALVAARLYAGMDDLLILQVSPLRLDLWILIVLIAYKKGYNHWGTGLVLALLLLFHRNLGAIYLISYFVFLASMVIFGWADLIRSKNFNLKGFISIIISCIKGNLINLLIILASLIICQFFMGGVFSGSALLYRKYGFALLPISSISFYWYVPIIFSALVAFLAWYRGRLSEKYFSISLLIIALAIGESMYFFGRSHENNILNISGILVLVLFIFFDLIIFIYSNKAKTISAGNVKSDKKSLFKNSKKAWVLPMAFIFFTGYYYADRASVHFNTQLGNLQKSRFYYPIDYIPMNIDTVKSLTNNSPKVFFLDWKNDFYYFYYGHYAPLGYSSPLETWIFKKDLEIFLQSLLDKQYYLVLNESSHNEWADILSQLKYNHLAGKDNILALSKDNVPLLFPATQSIVHIGIPDSLGKPGIDIQPVILTKEFTIELLIKPVGRQPDNATILCNLLQVDSSSEGFSIRQNGNVKNQYLFSFGNGKAILNSPAFALPDNSWNYLTISFGQGAVKIMNNGQLLVATTLAGNSLQNSAIALTVGNFNQRSAPFSGFIKEIKIDDHYITEAENMRTWESFKTSL